MANRSGHDFRANEIGSPLSEWLRYMKRLEATVYGRVQGVSFRYYTKREAERLNLVGWVANQRDGAVCVVAEGPEEVLLEFETFLHRASPAAYVSKVESRWFAPSGEFFRFEVRWL